ncbi:MAG: Crp/Fnr family transcriptional regulator [Gammaproteobacteria bacterium]|nr:Crp/Fnr family transcriptional regulator [Gammaproteobacteria bacterium]
MLPSSLTDSFSKLFPQLTADGTLFDELGQYGDRVKLPPGQHICLEGNQCSHLALILSGTARVYKLGESGKEITLYRVEAGESCVLTLSCIVTGKLFPAFAISESDVEAVVIPTDKVRNWMEHQPAWRDYAWNLIANRLADVITLVDEITFRRMDERLAGYLQQQRLQHGDQLTITHQQIAADLGSSREVISRLLKDLQQRGELTLGRGQIVFNPDR